MASRFINAGDIHVQNISSTILSSTGGGKTGAYALTEAAAGPGISWGVVWCLGMIVCICYFTAVYVKCRRKFSVFKCVDNEYIRKWFSQHRLMRKITIGSSKNISSPITCGIFHPVILVPENTDWSETSTLGYVLEHEYIHIRHFDTTTKIIFTAVLCIHWFNPFVWAMYIFLNRDLELICDEAVVSSFGESAKAAYALCLIGMEENRSSWLSLYNNFKRNTIEERIGAIMRFKNKTLLTSVLSALLIAGAFVILGTSAMADSQQDRDDSSVYVISDKVGDEYDRETQGEYMPFSEDQQKLYGEFGLSLNPSDNRLYRDGKRVRFFIDNLSDTPGSFSGRLWTEETGDINLLVIRDENKEITELKEISLEEARRLSGNVYTPAA